MRKLLASILEVLTEKVRGKELKAEIIEKTKEDNKTSLQAKKPQKIKEKKEIEVISPYKRSLRDFTEMMENPFLALSKNRKNPIIYESPDGTRKIKVTRHTGHFLASIYDWDIIIFVEGKIQKILNESSDIPPRTIIFPVHEMLKTLRKHNGKKEENDLKKSLARLKLTGIETTLRNEDNKYDAGFGFIDNWKYVERKNNRDVRQIQITLSQWLYDGICSQGALLKVSPSYFSIKSSIKRFLYRTARKHAGNNENGWDFSIEELYDKSGSEREFKKFKSDLRSAVLDNNIPDYSMELIEKNGKEKVFFRKSNIHELSRLANLIEECKEKQENNNDFNKLNKVNE